MPPTTATLPKFIRTNGEAVLVERESFARGLPLGGSMDIASLRDHAKEMLAARALRASVIHLWMVRQRQATASDLQELIRFNEAIDQAIAESISTYAQEVALAKERFLAILGHDLRTPIGAIVTSTRFMLDTRTLDEPPLTLVARMEKTVRRMKRLCWSSRGRGLATAFPSPRSRWTRHAWPRTSPSKSDQGAVVNVESDGDTTGA